MFCFVLDYLLLFSRVYFICLALSSKEHLLISVQRWTVDLVISVVLFPWAMNFIRVSHSAFLLRGIHVKIKWGPANIERMLGSILIWTRILSS